MCDLHVQFSPMLIMNSFLPMAPEIGQIFILGIFFCGSIFLKMLFEMAMTLQVSAFRLIILRLSVVKF